MRLPQFLVAPAFVKQSDLSYHHGVCLVGNLFACLSVDRIEFQLLPPGGIQG